MDKIAAAKLAFEEGYKRGYSDGQDELTFFTDTVDREWSKSDIRRMLVDDIEQQKAQVGSAQMRKSERPPRMFQFTAKGVDNDA